MNLYLDNIPLQLNQLNQKSSTSSNSIFRQPLKHPKMRLKVPQNQNRFNIPPQPPIEISVSKKQGNNEDQIMRHQQMKQENLNLVDKVKNDVIINESQKQKALKFREKQLAEDLVARRLKFKQRKQQQEGATNNFDEPQNSENFNEIMTKISAMELPREFKDELVSY